MTRKLKGATKKVNKDLYENYQIKARDFLNATRNSILEKSWNAVGLNAVHSVISSADALSVYFRGERSISQKHSDVIDLLLKIFPKEEIKDQIRNLTFLIAKKNLVEYESRLFFQKEAEESAKRAERFTAWAFTKLP